MSQKDSVANESLTQKLRERFNDDKLRVKSICWSYNKKLIVVKLDRVIHESSFQEMKPVIVDTGFRDIPPEKSCNDEDVLCAIAENFPPEKLYPRNT